LMTIDIFKENISKYLPPLAVDFFAHLHHNNNVSLTIKYNRKTRLGSFTPRRNRCPLITINYGLNKYYFALVLAHEFAHFFAWQNNKGKRIPAHGQIWKNEYAKILKELLDLNVFPDEIKIAIINAAIANFSSKNANLELDYQLKKIGENKEGKKMLADIEDGSLFTYAGATFQKIETLKSRCRCKRKDKILYNMYSFHLLTEVTLV